MKNIILIFILFTSSYTFGQKIKAVEAEDTLNYDVIKMQALDASDNSDFTTFHFFDSVVHQSNIFFAGENHQYRFSNTKMQIKLLKYLNQNADVHALIMEFGFSRGWLLDQYINNEDSTYKQVFQNYSYKEYSDFYNSLREYNLSLPDSNRIHVYGIDVERFNDLPIKVLSLLLPNKNPLDSIALNVEALRGMAGYLDNYLNKKKDKKSIGDRSSLSGRLYNYNSRAYSTSKTTSTFIEDFKIHQSYYKEYLGDNFELFDKIVHELIDQQKYKSYYNTTQQYVFRERYMYNKFINLLREHPKTKIFGQFGRCHIAMDMQDDACNWFDFNAFAARINKSDNEWVKGKVCSFAYFYKDDETFSDLIDKNGKIGNILEKAAKLDTFVAVEVTADTTFFGNYASWYKFLIYNNKTKAEESEDLDVSYYSEEKTGNVSFYFGYREPQYDMSLINSFLMDNNFSALNTQINSLSFGMQVNQISGFCMGFNGIVNLQDKAINTVDTMGAKLNSGSFVWNWGWNFLNSEHFFLKPNIGIGVNTFRLAFYEGDDKINPNLDILGGRKSEVFMNMAFVMDFGFEAIIKFGYAGLGIKYGYLWDTSKGYWNNMDNIQNPTSPILKSSGQYAQASLFLMIDY